MAHQDHTARPRVRAKAIAAEAGTQFILPAAFSLMAAMAALVIALS
jgi:hypothetical protein